MTSRHKESKFAQAYTRVSKSEPQLYLAYLKEHEAKLATGARHGNCTIPETF
jgi:hypothetical protein